MNYFTYRNRRYAYTLSEPFMGDGERLMTFSCDGLALVQDFLVEDIPELIRDLPNLMEAHQSYHQELKQQKVLRFRVSEQDRKKIEANAKAQGFPSVSAFARSRLLEVA